MTKCIPILLGLLCSSSLPAQVDDDLLVEAEGTQVHVDVAGPSETAPLLLYLHGGPANIIGLVGFRNNVGRELEKRFLVAYLHERGVGLSPDVPLETQTLANHVSDVNHVVEFLTRKYAQDKVNVVGHSWGGTLAGLFAAQHAEEVDKLIFVSAPLVMKRVLADSLSTTLEWAKNENRTDAVQQLEGIDSSFATLQDFGTLNRWANQARGGVTRSIDVPAFMQTNHVDERYPDWQTRQANIPRAMIPEMLTIDLASVLPSFRQPALFVVGADDTIVPVASVRRDFERYGGKKTLVVIEGSHHLVFMDQPKQLTEAITSFLDAR